MTIREKFFLKLFPGFLCLFMLSVSPRFSAQKPISKNYKIEDGLLSNEAHLTFSDSKGYIWVATDGGLCRFDGNKFKTFSLEDGMPESTILKIYEDHKGRIWFISLSSYVGYILNDRVFNIKGSFKEKVTYSGDENFAYSIYVDKSDTLWVSTVFSALVFKVAPPYDKVTEKIAMKCNYVIEFNEKGDYIFGTYLQIKNKKFILEADFTFRYIRKWQKKEKTWVFPKADYQPMKHIVKINPGEFYIGGRYQVLHFDKGKTKILHEKNISFFDIDKQGALWLGIENKGIYHYPDPLKDQYEHQLKTDYYTWICTDIEGGYWLSSLYTGLHYIPDFEFKSIFKTREMGDCFEWNDGQLVTHKKPGDLIFLRHDSLVKQYALNVNKIMPDRLNKKIYFLSSNHTKGVQKEQLLDFNTNPVSTGKCSFTNNLGFNPAGIKDFYTKNDQFYGSDSYTVYHLNKNGFFEKVTETEIRINAFLVDPDEVVWIASNKGLLSYDPKTKKLINRGQEFEQLNIRFDHIAQDQNGILYLGTKGNGLITFDKKKLIRVMNTKTGLISNFIRKILIDDHNVLWLATNGGLSKIMLNNKQAVINYNFLNSFNYGSINNLSIINNYIYVSTSNGLYKFSIRRLQEKKQGLPLPLYITRVSSAYQSKIHSGNELSYSDNYLKFNFVALSYSHSRYIEFQYMIKGLDEKWNKTKNSFVEYNKLPPGNYQFIVKAVAGNKSAVSTASFQFSISFPFWKKWWFIGLSIMLSFSLIYLLFKLRLNTLAGREREKAKLHISIAEMEAKALRSQMNPHFMFNSFNSIQSYILQNESKLANYYLGKFSKLMRQILESSKHDKTSLSDEIDLLSSYLELEKMRHNDQFDFEIRFEGKVDTGKIGIPIMLIQPHIENAVLHGLAPLKTRPGKLTVDFEYLGSYLNCVVEDNGIGREAAEKINRSKRRFHQSISTSLTNERLELYNKIHHTNAKIEYFDLYDELNQPTGTKVNLVIPIIKFH